MSKVYQVEAMDLVLERKGVMTKDEGLEELKEMKREDERRTRGN